MQEFIKERLKQNSQIFSKEEINIISNNLELCTKIYELGIIDFCSIKKLEVK